LRVSGASDTGQIATRKKCGFLRGSFPLKKKKRNTSRRKGFHGGGAEGVELGRTATFSSMKMSLLNKTAILENKLEKAWEG